MLFGSSLSLIVTRISANVFASSQNLERLITRPQTRWKSSVIDRSNVPQLEEADLREQFVSGSGPGGQCVNKSQNCVVLKHIPTGIIVKVHDQRELKKNRKLARERMISRLDNLFNGDTSVENQKRRIIIDRRASRDANNERRRQMKAEYMALKEQGQV